jgi:hypothetical protein
VAVQARDDSATVGAAELVREDVRREPALDRQHGAGVAQLVKLQALALSPALPNDAERVAAPALRRQRGTGVIAEPDHDQSPIVRARADSATASRRQQPAASRRQPDHDAGQITLS